MPLRGGPLWTQIAQGQWIAEHRSRPPSDYLSPLSAGMPAQSNTWLSDLLLAITDTLGGEQALSNAFAIVVLATYLVLAFALRRSCGSMLSAMLMVALAVAIGWSRLPMFGPTSFGLLCLAVLLGLVMGIQRSPDGATCHRPWLGVFLVMLLWANLDGSFLVGIGVLACYFVGRLLEVLWQTRSVPTALNDIRVRRWLYLVELAVLASLINPNGIDLLLDAFGSQASIDLQTLPDYQPLVVSAAGGPLFFASLALVLLFFRFSRQAIPAAHWLLLAAGATAALLQVRNLTWYAPIAAVILIPHVAVLVARIDKHRQLLRTTSLAAETEQTKVWEWRYTLLCGLAVWVAFALSPMSQFLLGGESRTREQILGPLNPIDVAKADLKTSSEDGLLFAPYYWSDWLVREAASDLKVFANSNAEHLPRQVWRDYRRIAAAQQGWERALDRYRVESIVVDAQKQGTLAGVLRQDDRWRLRYEDDEALVFVLDPEKTPAKQPAAAEQETGQESRQNDEAENKS